MSRTTRKGLTGVTRDGKTAWKTIIARDRRATGLRDHRRDRREARTLLKGGDGNALASGKRRRYSNRYGDRRL